MSSTVGAAVGPMAAGLGVAAALGAAAAVGSGVEGTGAVVTAATGGAVAGTGAVVAGTGAGVSMSTYTSTCDGRGGL